MGLDITSKSHRASWSYGGFHEFRLRLAKEIGVDLEEMRGFNGTRLWNTVESPLKELLNHSDCDGEIAWDDCKLVAAALLPIINKWGNEKLGDIESQYDYQEGKKLVAALVECAERGEPLKFH